jgi:hypothetical protein
MRRSWPTRAETQRGLSRAAAIADDGVMLTGRLDDDMACDVVGS